MLPRIVLFSSVLVIASNVSAQEVSKQPDLLMFGENTIVLNTPSIISDNESLELLVGNEGGLGDFSPVRTFYAYGSVNSINEEGKFSKTAMLVSSERQGPFIQQNYIRIDHARKIKLAESEDLSFGLSGGLINMHIKSSSSTGGSSSWLPDLYGSLTYRNNGWNLSLGGGQLLDKEMTGFHPPILFARFYQTSINKEMRWSDQLSTSIFSRYLIYDEERNEFEIQVRQYFNKDFFCGLFYRRVLGAGVNLGIRNLKVGDNKLNCGFGYQFNSLHKTLANAQRIHVFLNYQVFK